MAWKLIAVTLQTHRTILTRTEAIMPVMGPFTWLALGGSTAFVGQVWRRGPWDRREIIFTHGQDFSVSCLQLCKQPSPKYLDVGLSLGLAAGGLPRGKWYFFPGEDRLYTSISPYSVSRARFPASVCSLLQATKMAGVDWVLGNDMCPALCQKGQPLCASLVTPPTRAPKRQEQQCSSYTHCIQVHHNRTVKMLEQ